MATAEEIAHRVAESDTARSANRSAAAKEVGQLAGRQAVVAEELRRIEAQLGTAVVAAQEVLEIKELARFTDVPVKDLVRWSTAQKPARGRRKHTDANSDKPARAAAAPGPRAGTPTAAPVAVS
jgi:hypothetical protein